MKIYGRILQKSSVYYADKVGEEIEASIEKLTTNPLIGPEEEILKRYKSGHRYIIHSHYKIIYRVSEDKIFISAIFHTRQRPSKLKKVVKKGLMREASNVLSGQFFYSRFGF